MRLTDENRGWALWDFTKMGLPDYVGGIFVARADSAYENGSEKIYLYKFDDSVEREYGLPYFAVRYDADTLDIKWFGKKASRLPQSFWLKIRGFDEEFFVPHSRHTTVYREDIEKVPELKVLASSDEVGVHIVSRNGGRQFFIMGHSEYDPLTLDAEYRRDVAAGLPIKPPVNYYKDNDPEKGPVVRWRAHGSLLFINWLNYFVYQSTPYDLKSL